MGKKPAGKRQHLLFFLTGSVSILFGFLGCIEKDAGYHAKKSIESLMQTQGERELANAKNLMAKGYFEASLNKNKRVLQQYHQSLGDQALFQIALIYAHPDNPDAGLQKSVDYFQKLLNQYPESNLKGEAETWVWTLQATMNMSQEINNLRRKLERVDKYNREKTKNTKQMQRKINELQVQIIDLKSQIDRLKSVDLGIEEKKRQKNSE
jgi:hypothetical protein